MERAVVGGAGVEHPDTNPLTGAGAQRRVQVLVVVLVEHHGVRLPAQHLRVVAGLPLRSQVQPMTGKPLFRQKLENLPGRMPAMAADLQLQARALGDPTRYRLFRYIADAQGPVTVAELISYAGLNHNAIRQHLAVLRDAGLVTEEAERRDRPGRPRLLYRLRPEAAGEWGTPGAFAWLAGLLSAALRREQDPRQAADKRDTAAPRRWPARVIRLTYWSRRYHGGSSARSARTGDR